MKCLRCGYCCHKYFVTIIDNPDLKDPFVEGNVIVHKGDGPCKHLRGDKPGEYSCSIHDRSWYKDTPCFSHGQIESHPTDDCRMGRYILDNHLPINGKD